MALDEKNASTSGKKKKVVSTPKEKKAKEKPPSKVIIRRLPPTMTEDVFLEQISPIPENDFFYFVQGEQHTAIPTFSRAYINFRNQEDIFTFQDKFDGYVFLDQRGTEFPAVVEFAPYQKIPQPDNGKEDKCNTLDSDPLYLDFLKKLENPDEVVLQSAESYLEQLEQKERELKANGHNKMTTPLVEFIVQRRLDRERFREEKKDERRRKDFEKKKQRELERLNKKREGKKKDDKMPTSAKGKRDDDQPPTNPIKVLKNTERVTAAAAAEKHAGLAAEKGAVAKKPQNRPEPSRAFNDRPKEKVLREPRQKVIRGPKQTADSSNALSAPKEVKGESAPQPSGKKTPVRVKDEASNSRGKQEEVETVVKSESAPQKGDEDRTDGGGRKRTEKESDRERKIRNKDRPAIQIYRPGAKRVITSKLSDERGSSSATPPPEGVPSSSSGKQEVVKSRTFSKSKE